MSQSIKDGRTGHVAVVDERGHLHTKSTTETAGTRSAVEGDQFSLATGVIELTSDSNSAMMYLKNTEADSVDWAVTQVSVVLATSMNGVGEWFVGFSQNGSMGTIIDSGDDITPGNFNIGSAKPLAIINKAGFEGATLDGLTGEPSMIPTAPNALNAEIDVVVMPQGTSLGIFVTPPAGNTSVNATVTVSLYRLLDEV